jgi:hypothetical protein
MDQSWQPPTRLGVVVAAVPVVDAVAAVPVAVAAVPATESADHMHWAGTSTGSAAAGLADEETRHAGRQGQSGVGEAGNGLAGTVQARIFVGILVVDHPAAVPADPVAEDNSCPAEEDSPDCRLEEACRRLVHHSDR